MKLYVPRLIVAEMSTALKTSGALMVQGARAVGKTESSRQLSSSELRLDSSEPRTVVAREQPVSALSGVEKIPSRKRAVVTWSERTTRLRALVFDRPVISS